MKRYCFLVMAILLTFCIGLRTEKADATQYKSATVEGTIRNLKGEPMEGVTVLVRREKTETKETKSDRQGKFAIRGINSGRYLLLAEKAGFATCGVESLEIREGAALKVELVLRTATEGTAAATCASAITVAGAMEFADEPNFTVAGVTDWSNAGLHGSDTNVRTSEMLTKEAAALKSGERERNSEVELRQERERLMASLAAAESADIHRWLGDIAEKLGDFVLAVNEFEKAARLEPSEENYFAWGAELLLHRATKPAEEVFTKGTAAHPESARMMTGWGAALYASGKYDEAAQRICEASDKSADDPAPYLFLGMMEKAATDAFACSEERFKRFATEQPGNASANYFYALAIWKRARKSEDSGELKKAEALLEKAVALDPKLADAYVQLGVVRADRGNVKGATEAYQKAIAANPEIGAAHYRLSLAYKRAGEDLKARQEMQKYQEIEKTESAAKEKERREMRQFLVILKVEKEKSAPQ